MGTMWSKRKEEEEHPAAEAALSLIREALRDPDDSSIIRTLLEQRNELHLWLDEEVTGISRKQKEEYRKLRMSLENVREQMERENEEEKENLMSLSVFRSKIQRGVIQEKSKNDLYMRSSSALNAPLRKNRVANMLSYTYIFVAIALWISLYSLDISQMSSSHDMFRPTTITATSITKVLIVRTVSPSETDNVISDVMHVKSFYTRQQQHEELKEKASANCPLLKVAGYSDAPKVDPYTNGSQYFPNYILCSGIDHGALAENNFFTVRVDIMLFSRGKTHAQHITQTIGGLSKSSLNQTSIHEVKVHVKDVSRNPKKIWNWLIHSTAERLAGYDYVWFIDGDIHLRSLNWQAFWQQVKLMRPKIAQAATIGQDTDNAGSDHKVLRYNPDSRVMAAETSIIEVQSPLLEVRTWLDFRAWIVNDTEPMALIEQGAEQCFDMAWCHWSKNKMQGKQEVGQFMPSRYQPWHPKLSLDENDPNNHHAKGRSCVVFYQTPIVHISGNTINMEGSFQKVTKLLLQYFRLKKGVIGKGLLEKPHSVFLAPDSSQTNDLATT